MESLDEVLGYTLESLNEYNNQSLHKIVSILIDNGIATKKEDEKEKSIFIGKMTDKVGLSYCLSKDNSVIKSIERWEFDKNYKYSAFFDLINFDKDILAQLILDKNVVVYERDGECEELFSVAKVPSLIIQEDVIYLKFNFKLDATDAFGEKLKKRYSILAIFYTKHNLLELRFESLKNTFSNQRFRYVYDILSWIRRYLNLSIYPMDLNKIVEYIKENGKKDKVVLSGQDMLMATGGKATVEVGNSDETVLPFIGELKLLMQKYCDEFDKVPELKQIFDEFIYEKENLSEFPWVKFRFEEPVFEVKFTFDYGKEHECQLQHFHSPLKSNQGRERMDYVTQYIIKVRDIIAGLPAEQE